MTSTDKLLPCPFCGGEAHTRTNTAFDKRHKWTVECDTDGCNGFMGCAFYATEAEAIAAWNTRAERTCHVVSSYFYDDYDIYEFQLSCGHEITMHDAEPPNYCPNCGAKVMRND